MGVAFFAGMMIGLIIIGVIIFICYVCDSIMKMKIFRLFGTAAPIMAWIPWYSSYLLGKTCTGRDGQNIGIFGMSVPNWLWEFGWVLPAVFSVLSGNEHWAGLMLGASQVFSIIYYCSIYSFLYSRLEGKPEPEVRVEAILSGIIGLVGLIKILGNPTTNVFSLQNDVYPVEQAPTYGSGDKYVEF